MKKATEIGAITRKLDGIEVISFSNLMEKLSNQKTVNTEVENAMDSDLCNKLFNNGKVKLYDGISISNLKLICDFCKDGAISKEVVNKLFEHGLYVYNEEFFNKVSISELYSMKKKFSVEAQKVVKNKLNDNRKKLLDKLDLKKPEAYGKRFSKFVFKLYCFQICFCGSLDLGDTEKFIKLIPSDTINTFVLATYFENNIDNKNASPKDFDQKNNFSIEDKKMLKQLFSNSTPELATKILTTHNKNKNKNKLNLDELKIIILARYGFNNDEEFKNKIKDLSKNEIDDNFLLNNSKLMIPNDINHICYFLWLAAFLSKSQNQENELKFSSDFKCLSNIFQLFKFFLTKRKDWKLYFNCDSIHKYLNPLIGSQYQMKRSFDFNVIFKEINLDKNIIDAIKPQEQTKRYYYWKREDSFVLFIFTKEWLTEIVSQDEYYNDSGKTIKNKAMEINEDMNNIADNTQNSIDEENKTSSLKNKEDENEEQNKINISDTTDKKITSVSNTDGNKNNITGFDNQMNYEKYTNDNINNNSGLEKIKVEEQNKNNITEFDNQMNYKRLKIIFVILGAVSIISVAFLFINIFYFELAVFHFLNILLIALFVVFVFFMVALSIAAKNINTSQENLCLRSLFDYLILSEDQKTKSIGQNLNINSQTKTQNLGK